MPMAVESGKFKFTWPPFASLTFMCSQRSEAAAAPARARASPAVNRVVLSFIGVSPFGSADKTRGEGVLFHGVVGPYNPGSPAADSEGDRPCRRSTTPQRPMRPDSSTAAG